MIKPRDLSPGEFQEFLDSVTGTATLASQEQVNMLVNIFIQSPYARGLEQSILEGHQGNELRLGNVLMTALLAGFLLGRSLELQLMARKVQS